MKITQTAEFHFTNGKYHVSAVDMSEAKALISDLKRKARNTFRREQNQILRDLCGTSARAAREDMGL